MKRKLMCLTSVCAPSPHFPTVTVHAERVNVQNQCLHFQQDSGVCRQNKKDRCKYQDVYGMMYIFECLCMYRMPCFVFSHQAMEYLPFEGTVSLKSPQHIFCLLEDYGTDPNNIPEHPNYIYFGRWVRFIRLFVYTFFLIFLLEAFVQKV